MGTVSRSRRIASTAAWSAASLSPRPTQRAAASAAASVTRTSSRARLRSGLSPERTSWEMTPASASPSVKTASDGTRRLALDGPPLLGGSEEPGRRYPGGGDQRDPVAPLDARAELEPLLGRGLVDDPVVEDQHEGDEADDHRHLARRPGQGVPADDDPAEDRRRQRGPDQQPAHDREGLPAGAAELLFPA